MSKTESIYGYECECLACGHEYVLGPPEEHDGFWVWKCPKCEAESTFAIDVVECDPSGVILQSGSRR